MKHRPPSCGKLNDKDRQENQSAKLQPDENGTTAHPCSQLFELSIDILSITELDGFISDVSRLLRNRSMLRGVYHPLLKSRIQELRNV